MKLRNVRREWLGEPAMREREIKVHELGLLQEQIGSSNAARVRRCSTPLSNFLWVKGLPPCFRSARK